MLTLVASLPSGIHVALRPTKDHFLYALVNTSLSFFLFSFQVHEKSILLAVMPMTLLLDREIVFVRWFTIVANFSMFPLLKRDGVVPAYVVSTLLWLWLTRESISQGSFVQNLYFRVHSSLSCWIVIPVDFIFLSFFFFPWILRPRTRRCWSFICSTSL